ncbi:hypothetical protein [Streptomyces mirabilis]
MNEMLSQLRELLFPSVSGVAVVDVRRDEEETCRLLGEERSSRCGSGGSTAELRHAGGRRSWSRSQGSPAATAGSPSG